MGANSRLGAYSNKYGSPTQIYLKLKKDYNYRGTPLIRSPMGQKTLAVLTRVFFTRKCMAVFARRPKKVAVITRLSYYRGGRKAGFHCNMHLETGYSTKKSSNSSIVLCVLRDAYHELFCIFGDFHASETQDVEVTKSLNLSAQRFLRSYGWPIVTYDWIVVALTTVDQSKLTLLPLNYPRNHCAQSL